MQKISFFVFILLLLSCARNTTEVESPVRPLNEVEKHLVSGSNDFAFRLFKIVNQNNVGKNVVISPFSVAVALSMAMNGARGETFQAMQSTLALQSLSLTEINSSFKEIFSILSNLDRNVNFTVGNSIWARLGVKFEQDFFNELIKYYDATCEVLDFDNPDAKNVINKWVDDKTKGKIKDLIRNIPPYAVMYIINAIYFKGNWKYTFDKSKTRDGDFFVSQNNVVKSKFMYQVRNFDCYFDKEFSALRLPYGKGNFAMIIILPNFEMNIDDFIANFNLNEWELLLKNIQQKEEVTVFMPKFKTEFDVGLKEILAEMGMGIAFSDFADFSGLCKTIRCQITDVKHKALIEVDEEGTEATAATSIEIGYTSYKPAFYLTRPFIYAIYEKETGIILFIGKLNNPSISN